MSSRVLLTAMVLSLTSTGALPAGDYTLHVVDREGRSCAPPAADRDSKWHPVRTSGEVAHDLHEHLVGGQPELPAFRSFLANAHVSFCGKEERRAFEAALIDALWEPKVVRRSDLEDYVFMFASCSLLRALDSRSSAEADAAPLRESVERARSRLVSALEARHAMPCPDATSEPPGKSPFQGSTRPDGPIQEAARTHHPSHAALAPFGAGSAPPLRSPCRNCVSGTALLPSS